MAKALDAGLMPGIVAQGDWIIQVTAIDPASGALVSGVVVSNVSIAVDPATDTTVKAPASPNKSFFVGEV